MLDNKDLVAVIRMDNLAEIIKEKLNECSGSV